MQYVYQIWSFSSANWKNDENAIRLTTKKRHRTVFQKWNTFIKFDDFPRQSKKMVKNAIHSKKKTRHRTDDQKLMKYVDNWITFIKNTLFCPFYVFKIDVIDSENDNQQSWRGTFILCLEKWCYLKQNGTLTKIERCTTCLSISCYIVSVKEWKW